MRIIILFIFLSFKLVLISSCKKKSESVQAEMPCPTNSYGSISNTFGFGILAKLPAIWNGPVTSNTALGGYPEWIIDFRPISENQVSSKNELDSLNDIFMSFFVAKYNNQYKIAFRNGGSFNGMKRVAYFLADSVSESSNYSYYRFSEILKGKSRAYTEVIFSNDSLYIKAYTNQYNALTTAVPHMTWRAKRKHIAAATPSISLFNFPKKTLTIDFSATFSGMLEAIFLSPMGLPAGDPYPETSQPYLGSVIASYSYIPSLIPQSNRNVFLMITTQPLFSGFSFNTSNLDTRSRYVILNSLDPSYMFNYMHPGTYYFYSFYDADGNKAPNSGDWISTANATFNLPSMGTISTNSQINFVIP